MREIYYSADHRGFMTFIIRDVNDLPEVMSALHSVLDPVYVDITIENCDYDQTYDIHISPSSTEYDPSDDNEFLIINDLFCLALDILRRSYHFSVVSHNT